MSPSIHCLLSSLNVAVTQLQEANETGDAALCAKLETLITNIGDGNGEPAASITVDGEYLCENGEWVYNETVYTDGTATATSSTPTAIPCDQPQPDIERIRYCNSDTKTYIIETTSTLQGVTTFLQTVDTGEPCEPRHPECVKWSSIYVQMDNTGTLFNESHTIELPNSDGSTSVITTTPQSGFSQQISHWADLLNAEYNGTFDARCTNGCGGLLPPPSDSPPQKGIVARYVQAVFCPTETRIPVAAEIIDSSNPARIGRKLPLFVVEGPEYRGQVCRTCEDGAGQLQYENGSAVPAADLPACYFSCAETIPSAPTAACEFDALETGCDTNGSEDPADWTPVTRIVAICEGVITASYHVPDPADPTALIDHELVGDYVDCESGEPVPDPPALCDTPSIVPCETEATCAWNLNLGEANFPITISEGGWTWTICGEQTVWPEGTQIDTSSDLINQLNTINNVTAAASGSFLILELPCECAEPPTLTVGDDPPIEFARNAKLDTPAATLCAQLTTGKNDDRRDTTLTEIRDLLDSVIGICPACDEPTETVIETPGIWSISEDGTTMKINGDATDPVLAAVQACLDAGAAPVTVTATGPDGDVTFLADTAPDGTLVGAATDADPASSEATSFTVSCEIAGEDLPCIRTGPNCTNNKLDTMIGLLSELVECLCKPCETETPLNQRCSTYENPLTSGYRNWSDADDFDLLADEFGYTAPPVREHWVRIIEHDCAGTAQPTVGQIFGPYPIPTTNGADQAITDIGAATANTCITIAPNANPGPSGIGSKIDISYDSAQDATLVIQEGISDGAGGVFWFTSAQGFTVRSGVAGDFVSSSGNTSTSNYAAQAAGDIESYVDGQDCETI